MFGKIKVIFLKNKMQKKYPPIRIETEMLILILQNQLLPCRISIYNYGQQLLIVGKYHTL